MRRGGRRGQRGGSALLEFAIGFAVLAPIAVGGAQFLFSFLELQQLQVSVLKAAREASDWTWDSAVEEPSPEFRRRVENLVLYGSEEEGTKAVLPQLERDQVQLEVEFEQGIPRRLRVAIRGYRLQLPGGGRELQGSPSATFPFRGRFGGAE